jgi:hypothetical protein
MIKRKAINGSKVAGIAAVNDGSCSQFLIIDMLVVFMGSKVQGSPFKVAKLRSPLLAVFQVRGFALIGMLEYWNNTHSDNNSDGKKTLTSEPLNL